MKSNPIPAVKEHVDAQESYPIVDSTPLPGQPNSPSNRCLFLGYRTSSARDFPQLLYFGESYAQGKELSEQTARERGYLMVQGFRGFELSPSYRRKFEQPAAVEPQLAGKG